MKKINFIRLLVLMLVLMTSINNVWAYTNIYLWGDMAGGNDHRNYQLLDGSDGDKRIYVYGGQNQYFRLYVYADEK